MSQVVTSTTEFGDAWHAWHQEREAYYGDPLGWVSLTGLYWLTDEPQQFAGLPGRWKATLDGVFVDADSADGVHVDGVLVDGTAVLQPVEGAPGLLVDAGDLRIEVIRRTGNVALRVHDPKAATLESYNGIPSYGPDPRWAVQGTFTAFDASRTVTTGAVVEGLEHHHTAVGVIDFSVGGTAQQVVAFAGKTGGFQVLFTDGTSGITTYPAARTLAVGEPADDGSVTLDFNRASNLPCAFTDFATCPVAPRENKLTVAVEAGEKNPR